MCLWAIGGNGIGKWFGTVEIPGDPQRNKEPVSLAASDLHRHLHGDHHIAAAGVAHIGLKAALI